MAVEHTDELFIKRIRDLARLSERRGMMACSDFLTLYEQNMLRSVSGSLDGVVVTLSGGYPEAERRLAAL